MIISQINKSKKTIILIALFCCGKTTLAKTSSKYTILDLDEEIEPKTTIKKILSLRSIYFDRIKESIGLYDFIFLPVKQIVFNILHQLKQPYILVYPENTSACKQEWERRNKQRNTEWLWEDNKPYWQFLITLFLRDHKALSKYTLSENQYLSDIIDKIYLEQTRNDF